MVYDIISRQIRENEEGFTARLVRNTRWEDGCLIWTASRNSKGYGRMNFRHEGRHVQVLAHRVFWVLSNHMDVPIGQELDHTCCNRACVLHLEAVDHPENMRRIRTRR